MNISLLLPLSVFFVLVAGIFISFLKDEEVWSFSVIVVFSQLILTFIVLTSDIFGQSIITVPLFSEFGISFAVNEFGALFAFIGSFLWCVSVVTGKEYFKTQSKIYYTSLLVTFAGILGVFYANDLYTLFIFFEIMSLSSYFLVRQKGNNSSKGAANIYLAYGIFGGICMLLGVFVLYSFNTDLSIANLTQNFSQYANDKFFMFGIAMLFIGFGAKVGVFMLHDWLPEAHAFAPAPASGLLSGILTKAGVYGILIITLNILPESETWAYFILCLGIVNMLYGGICAFFSGDLKKTLAFSTISQMGFIMWGIGLTSLLGEHNAIVSYGVFFHAINHSLLKIILFSLSGVIYQNTHSTTLEDLKGFGKDKPWLKATFGIGALSLMGIPLFSGYISKTLLHEGMIEFMHEGTTMFLSASEWLFIIAGGFTFAYMLKLFICIFVREGNFEKSEYATKTTKAIISVACLALIPLGALPTMTFNKIGAFTSSAFGTHVLESVEYFSFTNLKGSIFSVAIGLILYFTIGRKYVASRELGYKEYLNDKYTLKNMVYIKAIRYGSFVLGFIARMIDVSLDIVIMLLDRIVFKPARIPNSFFNGKQETDGKANVSVQITYSLAYSLLLFGIGFVFTILYLLLSEF